MIVSHESQESLPLEGILGDLSHIWDAGLDHETGHRWFVRLRQGYGG